MAVLSIHPLHRVSRAWQDGDDNTVAASRWSCEGTEDEDFCELKFEFNDEYTVSHLDLCELKRLVADYTE